MMNGPFENNFHFFSSSWPKSNCAILDLQAMQSCLEKAPRCTSSSAKKNFELLHITKFASQPHWSISSKVETDFSLSQKSKLTLSFQTHICWVISVDSKVRLGQVKSEFDWKRAKLTRSVRALKLSMLSLKSYSVRLVMNLPTM